MEFLRLIEILVAPRYTNKAIKKYGLRSNEIQNVDENKIKYYGTLSSCVLCV